MHLINIKKSMFFFKNRNERNFNHCLYPLMFLLLLFVFFPSSFFSPFFNVMCPFREIKTDLLIYSIVPCLFHEIYNLMQENIVFI